MWGSAGLRLVREEEEEQNGLENPETHLPTGTQTCLEL